MKKMTWVNIIKRIMIIHGGKATFPELANDIIYLNLRNNLDNLKDIEAIIRSNVYIHSSDSPAFKGGKDLFYKAGTNPVMWGIR